MSEIARLLKERVLVIDGAMGTMLQEADLSAEDFGGPELEGCNENLVLTRPELLRRIHGAYLEAGADIIETNTFGATSLVLAEYDLQDKAREINRRAAEIAREAAAEYATPERPRFVAGAMGPTTKALTVTGGTTFDELFATYKEQALGLIEGGVDALLVETAQDGLNVKAACLAIKAAEAETGRDVPMMLSFTIEPMGTMLAGQGVEAFWTSIQHFEPVSVGLNCATGPEFMTDHLRTLADLADCAVTVYPNAGLPDENGEYEETPQSLATKLRKFVQNGWVNAIGGCCGTTPDHIRAIADVAKEGAPRTWTATSRRAIAGVDAFEVDPENRPVLVGERTNVIGSRKFKKLVQNEDWETASEVGRAQVKAGAQVVDVCLADPDRDELEDMGALLPELAKKVKAPFMIDSTDARVIELALRSVQGKPVVNSINLEDGEERFEEVAPLLRKYGAAVVVGTIDEDPAQGMAVTRQRKIEVAERAFTLLTEKYGVPASDIIFDPLVFPCASGDQNYRGSAVETIEGVRAITERFPDSSTILGVSNVSFGLPPAGREVLNSVFLYHCVKAGLTYAIVNTQALERYASIPEEERALAERLIFDGSDDDIAAFTAHFREKKPEVKADARAKMTVDERLALNIVEGTKEGLTADLDKAMETRAPLDIINGPLMDGMAEVGRLFNDNELIVAEVLQSAEAMKAAVAHLEPHMEKAEGDAAGRGKGRILLATVKGDVHDIGKNLVDIILSNNGFDVVNLGIKVTPEVLIQAAREHKPDMIGLSGLLVKSAQQMVITARDLTDAGIDVPLLVGGAALSKGFTERKIAPEYEGPVVYAKDAMNGLDLANQLVDPAKREALLDTIATAKGRAAEAPEKKPTRAKDTTFEPLTPVAEVPSAPNWKRHVLRDVNLRQVWPYVNPLMLYSKHLGLKGDVEKLVAKGDERAVKLTETVDALKEEILERKLMRSDAVYQWFPANADGDDVIIWDPDAPGEKELERFTFRRQESRPRRSLSDYLKPVGEGVDAVALFVVTAGNGVLEQAQKWKEEGAYLKSHAVSALALETAEALAERVHQRIRAQWGFPDDPDVSVRDLFKTKFRGCRYSFGYPACPDLEDQEKLFRLIRPEDIGVQLTDGFMMDPEASVSAIVFHHPEARYFNV